MLTSSSANQRHSVPQTSFLCSLSQNAKCAVQSQLNLCPKKKGPTTLSFCYNAIYTVEAMQWFRIQTHEVLHHKKKETNPPRSDFQHKTSLSGPQHSSVEAQGKTASSEKHLTTFLKHKAIIISVIKNIIS